MVDNPYVGPTAFTEGDSGRFFGRTAETRELTSLVIARRAVLLYSQSGAGKTSLLQASLIPELKRRKRMAVFPIARVMGGADAAADTASGNLYVANALAYLFPDGTTAKTLTDAFAAAMGGGAGAGEAGDNSDAEDGEAREHPHLVIFDQFEEVFTLHPELVDQRREFFAQLGSALADHPRLSLLLSLREDYLADLDAHVAPLPDRMRTRMRMERLKRVNALEAIGKPAAAAGMPFTDAAAEKLVNNLLRVRTGAVGVHEFAIGQYAEPVQLQIVCRRLWSTLAEERAPSKTHIEEADIDDRSVDTALIDFYHQSLARAGETPGVTERALRDWFGRELITPAGTRGLVSKGADDTKGLANSAVERLAETYVIRGDIRDGKTFYELAHDRLVEPILQDNQAWRVLYKNPVADALAKGADALLTGSALADALEFARRCPEELTDDERAFLKRSQVAARNRRNFWIGVSASAVAVIVVLSVATTVALQQKAAADRALAQASAAANDILDNIVDQLKDVPQTDDVRRDLLKQAGHVTSQLANGGGSIEDAHQFWQDILDGDLRGEAHDLPGAGGGFEQARDIAQRRTSQRPGDTYWRQNLSVAEDRLGRLDVLAGDDVHTRAATGLYRQAISIDESLVKNDPNNPEFNLQLWYAYRDLGIALDQLGDNAAETPYLRALNVAQALGQIDKSSRTYAENKAENLKLLAQLYASEQKLDLEYSTSDASRKILETLSQPRPNDFDLRAKVADSYYGLAEAALDLAGDTRPVQARIDSARDASVKGIRIGEDVASLEPTNIVRKSSLSKLYAQRSEIEQKACRTDDALKFANMATQNAKRLVDYDYNASGRYNDTEYDWQRVLMLGYRQLATVRKLRGEQALALAASQSALAIAQRLYDRFKDVNSAGDLYVVYYERGDIESRAGAYRAATDDIGKALDLAATPRFQVYPQVIEDLGRFKAARAALARGSPIPRLDGCEVQPAAQPR